MAAAGTTSRGLTASRCTGGCQWRRTGAAGPRPAPVPPVVRRSSPASWRGGRRGCAASAGAEESDESDLTLINSEGELPSFSLSLSHEIPGAARLILPPTAAAELADGAVMFCFGTEEEAELHTPAQAPADSAAVSKPSASTSPPKETAKRAASPSATSKAATAEADLKMPAAATASPRKTSRPAAAASRSQAKAASAKAATPTAAFSATATAKESEHTSSSAAKEAPTASGALQGKPQVTPASSPAKAMPVHKAAMGTKKAPAAKTRKAATVAETPKAAARAGSKAAEESACDLDDHTVPSRPSPFSLPPSLFPPSLPSAPFPSLHMHTAAPRLPAASHPMLQYVPFLLCCSPAVALGPHCACGSAS